MTVGAMQPYFFPYIGYFQLMQAVHRFIFLDDADFIKRGWINRNRILLDGDPHMISIPLVKASQNRPIHSIELGVDEKWKGDFLKKLEHAYKKAPYFDRVMPLVERVIEQGGKRIDQWAIRSCEEVIEYLGMGVKCFRSSKLDPEKREKGQDRMLQLCRALDGDRYINPYNGRHLYEGERFASEGVELRFLKTEEKLHYQQFKKANFVDKLSIIDVLMFNDEKETLELLDQYELIEPEA